MAEQTEQLESLNTHRQFFYLLSLYGCYDKTDLKNILNRSKSTIDTEIRLLKYYIEEEKRELKQEKTMTYAIPYHRYAPCENELINLFRQKNFTINQINYDFLLIFVLSRAKTPLSLTQCMEEIENISDLSFFPEDKTLSADFVRDTITELVNLDFVTETKEKSKKLYQIKENINFSQEDWERLYEVLSFFKNDGYFNSIGYFCQENVVENLNEQKITPNSPLEYPFAYKSHFPHSMLEDDIALTLMQAWEERVLVTFRYQDQEGEGSYKVAPLKILVNGGRRHLFAFDLEKNQPISLQLWQLERVEKLDGKKKKQKREDFHLEDYATSLALLSTTWSMTRLHLVPDPLTAPICLVEVDFYPNKNQRILDGDPLLWHRLQREKRQGTLEKREDSHYYFAISVIEPREMIPWIRSFGAQAKVRPSKAHDLLGILNRHRKELGETYGLVPPPSQ